MKLVDRRAECAMLDRLVEAVCAGQSRALVLYGEPGVGKPALLPTGRLDLLVDEQELARRAAEAPPGAPPPLRGYERLHAQHVLQADQGCDLDFLVDRA